LRHVIFYFLEVLQEHHLDRQLTGFVLDKEVALKMIKTGDNFTVAKNLERFTNLDKEVAIELIRAIPAAKRPIVTGVRKQMEGENVPWTSRFGRKFSNFWVALAGGSRLQDTQSGFRIYPLPEVLDLKIKSRRYQFEVEILIKAQWKMIPVVEAPVRVTYAPGGVRVSHFRPFVDFVRNFRTFARLIVQRLFVPAHVRRRW